MKKARLLIYLCALLVCTVAGGMDVSAATTTTNDIIVSNYTVSKSNITYGDEFDLTVTFEKGGIAPTNTKMQIDPGSFIVKNGSLLRDVSGRTTEVIRLKCNGTSSNKVTLTFNETIGVNINQSVNTITIDVMQASSDSSSTPTDTKKYAPKLAITNETVPSTMAGNNLELDLEVKNTGSYTAKDIVVEFVPPTDENFKYEINTISLVDKVAKLKKEETAKMSYAILVKSSTPPKTYKCTVKYTYSNLYGDVTKDEQDIYIKVTKGYPAIDLAVTDITTTPAVVNAGEEVNLSLKVNNNAGMKSVSKVTLSLEGLAKDGTSGFSITNGINSKDILNLSPQEEGNDVTFSLLAGSALKKGSYPLTVVLKYLDTEHQEQELKKEIYLNVQNENDKSADITIQNVVAPSSIIKYGKTFEVGFDVLNTGEADLRDVVITATGVDKTIMVPMTQNVQVVESLEVGATEHLTFRFQATDLAKTMNYLINVEVKGKGDNDKETPTFSQYIGVSVEGKPEEDENKTTSKPIIIISDFVIDPKIVNAGENFDVKLTFMNTHRDKKISNIKVSFSAEKTQNTDTQKVGSVFTPVDTSSTFHIEEIGPKQTVDHEVTFFTIPSAAAKVHNLDITFYYEYEGADGTILTETLYDAVRATVVQPSRFITSDINVPESVFVQEPVNISLEVSNTGKTTLDNFTIAVEGFGSSNSRQYLGNLEPGQTTYYDVDIFAEQPGEVTGNLVFSYTKPDGSDEIVKKEIKTMAQEMQMPSAEEMEAGNFGPPMEEEKKSNKMLYIIGGSIAGVIILIIIIVIIRKRKKKKELSFDE